MAMMYQVHICWNVMRGVVVGYRISEDRSTFMMEKQLRRPRLEYWRCL